MQAIILKKNIFDEGHEIITMYTRELGKVRGVARSIKSPKSKLSFGLQSLFYTDVDILPSRKLATIKGVKALDTFSNIYNDGDKVYLALYATEVILKSTADEQPNEELFDLYLEFLQHLDKSTSSEHACADLFALQSLALNGYALSYNKCAICGKDLIQSSEDSAAQQLFFSNRKSGFVCSDCVEKVTDAQNVSIVLYKALSDAKSIDFKQIDRSNLDLKELRKLTESFLTYILERNLNTPSYLGTL
ncbi:MAG: repair protein RecO [Candidatus Doudnabacteria bacterium]|nr:repair protein RecO [Candidatus Doudnabacteria bacterium]